MITRHFIEEDIELQRCAETPQEMKPRFDWSAVPAPRDLSTNRILVQAGDEESDLSIVRIGSERYEIPDAVIFGG